MPKFTGLCGPSGRSCRLVWNNKTFPNKVGIYPADLLPARRTIWYASDDGGFNFRPPLTGTGGTGLGGAAVLGGGIIGGLSGSGLFGSDISVETFNAQSHIALIFARTANRINVTHVISQSEINSINPETGIGEINVGEYVFEVVAVTDQKETIDIELTEQEKEDILSSNEQESDRSFRKLFEQNIPATRNRFNSIKFNDLGIEYRLDNGSPKSNSVFSLPGRGDLRNASYRDGSSKTILCDLKKIIDDRIAIQPGDPAPIPGSLQALAREPRAGDIIYLTYVAVKEHYIRQSISIGWTFTAQDVPPQCYPGFPVFKATNFRFYEWTIEPDNPSELPVRLGGWRAVESFNIPLSVISLVREGGTRLLADFLPGPSDGIATPTYMPADVTPSRLRAFINDQSTLPVYNPAVNANLRIDGASFHANAGKSGSSSTAYSVAPWYTEGRASTQTRYSDIIRHTFFNVHPRALNKRDIDKFAFDRSLAEAVNDDIRSGKFTFVPFMDDPSVNVPTAGSVEYLDATNTSFEPIQQVSSAFSAYMECGVGSSALLRTPSASGDVISLFFVDSPIITERLERDTRVLVERHVTLGGTTGTRTVAVEGVAGEEIALTTIADPSGIMSFTFHSNEESFLIFNQFNNQYLLQGLDVLAYRPDLESPAINDNDAPMPNQFEPLLGYSGMLGDQIGYKPGRVVSLSFYGSISQFKYKSTNTESVANSVNGITSEQIEILTFTQENNKIVMNVGAGYSGRTEIEYKYNGDPFDALLVFREGNSINNGMDGIRVINTRDKKWTLRIDHKWMKGDVIELVGDGINDVHVLNITVVQLKDNATNDFLSEENSSSPADKNAIQQGGYYTRSLFFESTVMSVGEDEDSRLFLFFNDKDGGISCLQSDDFGESWYFHYGVIEPIDDNESRHPFIVQNIKTNRAFIFYAFMGKILCKTIDYDDFLFEDALLIERFSEDIFEEGQTDGSLSREKAGLLSNSGRNIRRRSVSYVAAGDLTDRSFLSTAGIDADNNADVSTEERVVEVANSGQTSSGVIVVRKNPIAIGSSSAFTNHNITDFFFSAYRNQRGELRLFFLSPTETSAGGGSQLQCHFSTDDGVSWYDMWEYVEYQYNRLRTDPNTSTQYIDRSSAGEPTTDIRGNNPFSQDQNAAFGINLHWSRLKRHKTDTSVNDINAESQVLEIQSPYVFYQSFTNTIFVFYVYQGCLLCKLISEDIFNYGRSTKNNGVNISGMSAIKQIVEQNTKSHFVDGNLENAELREEIHRYINAQTNEKMLDGNIVFPSQYGIDTFNSDREVPPQRFCAHELPNNSIRVFYKLNGSNDLQAAVWNGVEWFVESLMHNPDNSTALVLEEPDDITGVTGGFGGTGFTVS